MNIPDQLHQTDACPTDMGQERCARLATPLMRQFIPRETFDQYATHLSASWAERTWGDVLAFSRDGNWTSGAPLNLQSALERIRMVEAGEAMLPGMNAWNIMAACINQRMTARGETVVLPWQQDIHPRLRSWSREAPGKITAVEQLESAYLDIEQLEESLWSQGTLF